MELRELLTRNGYSNKLWGISESICNLGVEVQLDRIDDFYALNVFTSAVIYSINLSEALMLLKSRLNFLEIRDFGYQGVLERRTINKDLLPDEQLLSKDRKIFTSDLLSHFFQSEDTDSESPLLVIYHSFPGVVRFAKDVLSPRKFSINDEKEALDLVTFLDLGLGRNWSHATRYIHCNRYSKISSGQIRSMVLVSLDETLANNYYHTGCTCHRGDLGGDNSSKMAYLF